MFLTSVTSCYTYLLVHQDGKYLFSFETLLFVRPCFSAQLQGGISSHSLTSEQQNCLMKIGILIHQFGKRIDPHLPISCGIVEELLELKVNYVYHSSAVFALWKNTKLNNGGLEMINYYVLQPGVNVWTSAAINHLRFDTIVPRWTTCPQEVLFYTISEGKG